MGSNIHLKTRAIALRKKGNSYNKIRKLLNIKSKGTLSLWFKNVTLTENQKKKLEKNNLLAYSRGLYQANNKRSVLIQTQNDEAYSNGRKIIGKISKRDLLLIGTALYWGEGTKSKKRSFTPLVFCNSDPKMVQIFMKFVREVLLIEEKKIRSGIHLYATISENKARKFWSKVTGLPTNRFYIVNQVSRASQSKRPFNTLPYGTVVIKINNRILFYRMLGMIQGINDAFL